MSTPEEKNNYGLNPSQLPSLARYRSFTVVIGCQVEDRIEGRDLTVDRVAQYVQENYRGYLADALQSAKRAGDEEETPRRIARRWGHLGIWENDKVRAVLVPDRDGTFRVAKIGRSTKSRTRKEVR